MRRAEVSRRTKETDIRLELALDGGRAEVDAAFAPLGHMLSSLLLHGRFGGIVAAKGDVEVDAHHLIEDAGIVLGEALDRALGDRSGIERFGWAVVPMDEALARVAIDLSGRPYAALRSGPLPGGAEWAGVPLTGWAEFFWGLARSGRLTVHADILEGQDVHHAIEAVFKAAGRALGAACRERPGDVPSTKGTIV